MSGGVGVLNKPNIRVCHPSQSRSLHSMCRSVCLALCPSTRRNSRLCAKYECLVFANLLHCTSICGQNFNVLSLFGTFISHRRPYEYIWVCANERANERSFERLFRSVRACTIHSTDARNTTRFGELVLIHVVIVVQWTTESL